MSFEDFLIDHQMNVVLTKLPSSVRGFCYEKDGWTIIFINESLCTEQQRDVCAHEMLHVLNGHLGQYDYQQCESEVQMLVKETEFVFE